MLNYFEALKTTIQRGEYLLDEMETRVERCWIDTRITMEQRDELLALAAECAREEYQIDIVAKFADHDERIYALEHKDDPDPAEQYPIWEQGMVTPQHGIVRFDVTGDGQLDLCRYDGGRAETSLSIGKIEGWHLLNAQLENVATITRDGSAYIITPIESA